MRFNFILLIFLLFNEFLYASQYNLTPFEYTYKKNYGSDYGKEISREYIDYLVNYKKITTLQEIKKLLNTPNIYLTYYNSVIKSVYNFYYHDKYDKNTKYLINRIYNRAIYKTKNTMEGVLLQDILMNSHDKRYKSIKEEEGICNFIYNNKTFISACKANELLKKCLNNNYSFLYYLNNKNLEYIYNYCLDFKQGVKKWKIY